MLSSEKFENVVSDQLQMNHPSSVYFYLFFKKASHEVLLLTFAEDLPSAKHSMSPPDPHKTPRSVVESQFTWIGGYLGPR